MMADNLNHGHEFNQFSYTPQIFSDQRKTEILAQQWREKQANKPEKPLECEHLTPSNRITLSKKTEELAANYR